MADSIKATPQNPWLAKLAGALRAAQNAGDTVQIPWVGGLGSLLLEDYVNEAEDLSYGNAPMTVPAMTRVPQFKKGRGDVYAGLLFDAAGGKGVAKVADKAAMAVGKAGERYAEKVVPQIMERGGPMAGLLQDMAQGSRSQIFIGPEAKTWRKTDAFKAAQMEKAKASPEDIWKATGTFRGPDGFWRQEIDDSASKFIDAQGIANKAQALRDERAAIKETLKPNRTGQKDLFPKELTEARKPLRAREAALNQELNVDSYGPTMSPEYRGNLAPYAYEHAALYEAYPELRNVVVKQGSRSGSDGVYGSYGRGEMDITRKGLLNDPRSTATHEFQHAVQDIEGFSPGGNQQYAYQLGVEAFNKVGTLNDQLKIVAAQLNDAGLPDVARARARQEYDNLLATRQKYVPFTLGYNNPYQGYRNLLGETEARAVQQRLGLSGLQRRERFPLLDYDTPQDSLIVPQHEDLFTPTPRLLD
jgi:hypothetical protein